MKFIIGGYDLVIGKDNKINGKKVSMDFEKNYFKKDCMARV